MTEVFSQGPCGVLKNQNNLSNIGHSERAEMHRHHDSQWVGNISKLILNMAYLEDIFLTYLFRFYRE